MNAGHDSSARGRGSMKYIWFNTDGQSAWLWKALAMDLGARLGLKPLLIVQSEQDKQMYLRQEPAGFDGEIIVRKDVYGEVVDRQADAISEAEILERARRIEDKYGVFLVRDILMNDRHLGRGFKPGAKGYGRSATSEAATFIRSIFACVSMYEFAEAIFDKFPAGISVSFGGQLGMMGRPFADVCLANAVPLRSIDSARFGPWFYWSDDSYENSGRFEAVFASTPEPNDHDVRRIRETVAPNILHESEAATAFYEMSSTFIRRLLRSVISFARYYYGAMRGYRKSKVGILPFERLAAPFRFQAQMNFYLRRSTRDLSRFAGRKKVFFPLQMEPEMGTFSFDVYLPNQLSVIQEIALSLPPDAVLLVKEHIWQFGQRDLVFLKAIAEIPNVVLVDHRVRGFDLIKQCDLVCTLTGSSGHEAAILGIPVLRYGQRGIINVLAHVHRATGKDDKHLIRSLLSTESESRRKERQIAGAKFAIAVERFGFDVTGFDFVSRKKLALSSEVEALSNSMIQTLDGVWNR